MQNFTVAMAEGFNECNGLIYKRVYKRVYKRECQEHFYPSAGGASLVRDFQPLSPKKTLVWCRALGCSISAAASFLVATTPISLETESSRALYGVNHGSI